MTWFNLLDSWKSTVVSTQPLPLYLSVHGNFIKNGRERSIPGPFSVYFEWRRKCTGERKKKNWAVMCGLIKLDFVEQIMCILQKSEVDNVFIKLTVIWSLINVWMLSTLVQKFTRSFVHLLVFYGRHVISTITGKCHVMVWLPIPGEFSCRFGIQNNPD